MQQIYYINSTSLVNVTGFRKTDPNRMNVAKYFYHFEMGFLWKPMKHPGSTTIEGVIYSDYRMAEYCGMLQSNGCTCSE